MHFVAQMATPFHGHAVEPELSPTSYDFPPPTPKNKSSSLRRSVPNFSEKT
jgi:hypothetical protein